jgi:hypothetical protein
MSTEQLSELSTDSEIQLAMTRWKEANDAESATREKCLDDLKFSTLEQWDQGIKVEREAAKKPCLVMDQITQTMRIVHNEYRLKRPALNISPVGDGADTDSADIIQGTIRHIEVQSDAEIAYDTTHDFVMRIGFGSWRFLTEYVDEDSDDQDIFIEPIKNPFTVYWQPGVPRKKAQWAFIIEDVPREQYKDEYKDSTPSTMGDSFTGTGNSTPDWTTNETVRIAEYFTIEERERKGKRPKKVVVWRKINAFEVLDGPKDLPGKSIPIFTATGDDIDVDGKRYLAGLVRPAKDPQRMANYWYSAATEKIALAKTAPWKAAEGTISGYERLWENSENVKVLPYKLVDVAGKPAPAPERQLLDPAIDALTTMTTMSQQAVKSAMGVYDPSLGQRKGDESGKAIQHLQEQGSLATVNLSDNVAREMKRSGYVLIDWIRFYIDKPRIQRIIMPDGTQKQVVIHNGPDQAVAAQKMLTDKITKAFDISVGRYDVAVLVDKGYQTKRQEATATQLELMQTLPNQAQFFSDIAVRNMDIPQSKEIADRLKKMLPQQLQDDDTDPEAQLQKLHQQLSQAMQQHDLLTKALQDTQKVLETKQIEQQGKMQIAQMQEQTKAEIVKMQEATKIAVAQINASKDANQSFAERELEQYKILHEGAHDIAMQKDQQEHEKGLATQQTAADQQTQESDQSHEADMTAANQTHEQQMAEQQQEPSE